MKYKELYKSGGLFTDVFASEYPNEYATIFIDTQSTILDAYSKTKYGEREVISAITDENKNTIISSVIAVNLPTWVKQAEVLGEEYDLLRPIIREIESTEETTRNEDNTNDITHSNKYFNDLDYEDGRKENRSNTSGRQERKTYYSTERGNNCPKSVSTIIKEEIELREYNIKIKVIKDLINEITLSIYK
jgi:hypothetical protein